MTPPADLAGATVGQLLIPVTDLERGTAYYRDTLGLKFLFSAPPQMSFFMAGTVRLLVGVPEQVGAAQRGSMIYFKVPDIHATHAALSARGVEFLSAPHLVHKTAASELWLTEFSDPDGNQLALMGET